MEAKGVPVHTFLARRKTMVEDVDDNDFVYSIPVLVLRMSRLFEMMFENV